MTPISDPLDIFNELIPRSACNQNSKSTPRFTFRHKSSCHLYLLSSSCDIFYLFTSDSRTTPEVRHVCYFYYLCLFLKIKALALKTQLIVLCLRLEQFIDKMLFLLLSRFFIDFVSLEKNTCTLYFFFFICRSRPFFLFSFVPSLHYEYINYLD